MLATFLACGFLLHDIPAWIVARRALPPGATVAFAFFAVGAIASDQLHMDVSRRSIWARGSINLAYLATCILTMLALMLLVTR
jgi:hypothetical protein